MLEQRTMICQIKQKQRKFTKTTKPKTKYKFNKVNNNKNQKHYIYMRATLVNQNNKNLSTTNQYHMIYNITIADGTLTDPESHGFDLQIYIN